MTTRSDVLVIDDELVVRGAVRKICGAEELTVDEAGTVDDGLELLTANDYRIVLLDLMLPAGGGMRVLEAMHRHDPATPVVMITGYATPNRKIECLRGGALDVLPKPFDHNELLGVLRRGLDYTEGAWDVGQGETYSLGRTAWVRIHREGTASLGIGAGFRSVLHPLAAWDLPEIESELVQGKRMAVLTDRDGLPHRVWSPLSGRVLDRRDAWTAGREILRIVPSDLENELKRLTRM